jgi:hypothetical protein
LPSGSWIDNRFGEALEPGANETRMRIVNLINHRCGKTAESGLLGPVRLAGYS